MNFSHVCLESIGFQLPDIIVTSDEIEQQLQPLYERLKLPTGRLELITGIQERRFWPAGMPPSSMSIRSGQMALDAADVPREDIGCLIHASVCRDHLEPATACRVHHELGLPRECLVYDVSNACLGLLNGALQIAQMIELGQIHAGLVVGTESSRQLVETTIAALNQDQQLTRAQIKPAIASLTIGSGSCALLLTHIDRSRSQTKLSTCAARAHTQHNALCQSGADEAGAGMTPLMDTDSETLLQEGIEAGHATFQDLLRKSGWAAEDVDRTVCHQVGGAHRARMLERLGVAIEKDFPTYRWLGNTGSVALPLTLAIAAKSGHLDKGQRVAFLGIGSGINSVMWGADWSELAISGGGPWNPDAR